MDDLNEQQDALRVQINAVDAQLGSLLAQRNVHVRVLMQVIRPQHEAEQARQQIDTLNEQIAALHAQKVVYVQALQAQEGAAQAQRAAQFQARQAQEDAQAAALNAQFKAIMAQHYAEKAQRQAQQEAAQAQRQALQDLQAQREAARGDVTIQQRLMQLRAPLLSGNVRVLDNINVNNVLNIFYDGETVAYWLSRTQEGRALLVANNNALGSLIAQDSINKFAKSFGDESVAFRLSYYPEGRALLAANGNYLCSLIYNSTLNRVIRCEESEHHLASVAFGLSTSQDGLALLAADNERLFSFLTPASLITVLRNCRDHALTLDINARMAQTYFEKHIVDFMKSGAGSIPAQDLALVVKFFDRFCRGSASFTELVTICKIRMEELQVLLHSEIPNILAIYNAAYEADRSLDIDSAASSASANDSSGQQPKRHRLR